MEVTPPNDRADTEENKHRDRNRDAEVYLGGASRRPD
jgi:hypothetical protein